MKYLLLFFIVFNFNICYSQSEENFVWIEDTFVSAIDVKDNFLYFGFSQNFVGKINLFEDPYQPYVTVAVGTGYVSDLLFYGDELYMAEILNGKIMKIDDSIDNPPIQILVDNLGTPSSLVIHNDYLYIAEATENKISRISLNQNNAALEHVVNASRPVAIELYNGELYIAEQNGDLISKIELDTPNATKEIVLNNIESPNGMVITDDILYYEANNFPNQNLYKLNLLELNPSPIAMNMPFWHNNPSFIFEWNIDSDNNLYRGKSNNWGLEGIMIYNLDEPLSINEINPVPEITMYPNPASDYIKFNNLNRKAHLKISNNLGQIIFEKVINGQEYINIKDLEAGMYLLNLDNLQTFKLLIKE